ncbi:MAG: TonB-dependent receptor [Pseudoxanthomonas sp.]
MHRHHDDVVAPARDRRRHTRLYAGLLLTGLFAPVPAAVMAAEVATSDNEETPQQAVDAASKPTTLDSIKVTASRRATLVEKTPMAISSITAETLDEIGAVDIKDFAAQVPGLRVQYSGPGASRINLRGINSSGEATVSVYNDESPVSGSVGTTGNAGGRSADMDLFDVDRIEVLRGPQGTLYGASSMGGAIRILYNKPGDELEGAVRLGYETTSGGDPSNSQEFMINVPIKPGLLAARATMYNREVGGYVDNAFLGIKNVNSIDSQGGRLQLRLTPNEDITLDLSHALGKTDAFSSTWHPSEGDYQQLSQVKLPYRDRNQMSSLNLAWDFGWAALNANASYQNRDSTYIGDDSYYISTYLTPTRCASAGNGGVACTPEQLEAWYAQVNELIPSALIHDGNTRDRTFEVRLTSADSDVLDWSVGAFIQNRDNYVASEDAPADKATGILITPWDIFYRRRIWDKLEQKAVFAEATWHATAKLDVTAGLRYYDYDKTVSGDTDIPWEMIGAYTKPYASVDASEDGLLKKLTLDYDLGENVMLYATVADGFRPGGANQVIGLDEVLTAYRSDSLWNYEIGAKTVWLDRSLFLNAALYQIDWDDMQITGRTLNGAFSFLSNAGAARMRGIELEAIWRPLAGLDLSANFNYVDAKLTEDQISDVISGSGRKGERIPDTPRTSGMLAASYRWPLGEGLDGMVRGDYSYVGGSWSSFNGAYNAYRPSYSTVGLRAGVEDPGRHWALYLRASNLTDEVAMNQYSLSSTPPFGSATSIRPRTIGLDFSYNF